MVGTETNHGFVVYLPSSWVSVRLWMQRPPAPGADKNPHQMTLKHNENLGNLGVRALRSSGKRLTGSQEPWKGSAISEGLSRASSPTTKTGTRTPEEKRPPWKATTTNATAAERTPRDQGGGLPVFPGRVPCCQPSQGKDGRKGSGEAMEKHERCRKAIQGKEGWCPKPCCNHAYARPDHRAQTATSKL